MKHNYNTYVAGRKLGSSLFFSKAGERWLTKRQSIYVHTMRKTPNGHIMNSSKPHWQLRAWETVKQNERPATCRKKETREARSHLISAISTPLHNEMVSVDWEIGRASARALSRRTSTGSCSAPLWRFFAVDGDSHTNGTTSEWFIIGINSHCSQLDLPKHWQLTTTVDKEW